MRRRRTRNDAIISLVSRAELKIYKLLRNQLLLLKIDELEKCWYYIYLRIISYGFGLWIKYVMGIIASRIISLVMLTNRVSFLAVNWGGGNSDSIRNLGFSFDYLFLIHKKTFYFLESLMFTLNFVVRIF